MNPCCMIIAPHPDDEINLGGGVIEQFKASGYKVIVVVTTNGDNDKTQTELRINELLQSKKHLGYDEIILLGYGDDYIGKHIYETKDNDIATSFAGMSFTYSVLGIETFHHRKYGVEASYTRLSLKNDIKSVILEKRPHVIICVDNDEHPDHRAVSLLFDECFGEILQTINYNPIVLKKYAYVGVYKGEDDYFTPYMRETTPSFFKKHNKKYVLPYSWNERIQVDNNSSNWNTLFFKSNIFKALRAHRSQYAFAHFTRICNSDIVFWYRSTNSLTYRSKISVSSGDARYLNDFKIIDTDKIREIDNYCLIESSVKCWHPDKEDKNIFVDIIFDEPSTIACIYLYHPRDYKVDIIQLSIDKCSYEDYELKKVSDSISSILIYPREVHNLRLNFSNGKGLTPKLYEIEVYSEMPSFPWEQVPLKKYNPNNVMRRNKLVLFLSYIIFRLYKFKKYHIKN